jgi:hypothetical protein
MMNAPNRIEIDFPAEGPVCAIQVEEGSFGGLSGDTGSVLARRRRGTGTI